MFRHSSTSGSLWKTGLGSCSSLVRGSNGNDDSDDLL